MQLSSSTISAQAKSYIEGNRGNAIIAVVVPIILAATINFFLSLIFTNEFILTIFSFVTGTLAAYMTTKMVLELVKGSYTTVFSDSLKPVNILATFIGISVLFFGLKELINLVLGQFFLSDGSFDVLLNNIDNISSGEFISLLGKAIPFILVSLILTTIIETKFFSAKYLVVEGRGIIDALKTSWNYTKGYFFGIITVHLRFLAYIFGALLLLFIGIFITSFIPFLPILVLLGFIIWVFCFFLPHYTYALGCLHLFLRKANGNPYVKASKRTPIETQTYFAYSEMNESKDTVEESNEEEADSWDF